jgi:hypothetical protein
VIRRVLLLVLTVSVAGCAAYGVGCQSGGGKALTIAAGQEATGETAAGRALARTLREHARLDVVVDPTTGAIENLRHLGDGDADVAITTADALADAVNGQGTFRGATVPARTLASLSDSLLHLIVLADSPVKGFSRLRGLRVSTGESGSATEFTALRALREALLDPERDITRDSSGLPDALAALRARRIDALFLLSPVPADAIRDATANGGLRLRLLSTASVVPLLQKRFGESLYSAVEFPRGTYGSEEPAATVAVAQVLVARADLPDVVAQGIAMALFDDGGAPRPQHPAFAGVTRARAGRAAPAATHPGAARYYRSTNP